MELSYTQCKQIAAYQDLRDFVQTLQNIPPWIEQDIELSTIQAIQQGGCASGAYMPAVTYWQAVETMSKHGDAVMSYIYDNAGEIVLPEKDFDWSDLAVFFLSYAVELWAAQFELSNVDWE